MTSPRWALMRRVDIPDLLDTNDIYLTRWRLVQTPWFALYLHAIRRPDHDRHLHDHPWPFATLILRGGYDEEYASAAVEAQMFAEFAGEWPDSCRHGVEQTWTARTLHRMRRGAFHSIRRLHRNPTWTLIFVGPRTGPWGYMTADGWIDADTYHHQQNPDGFPDPGDTSATVRA